MPNVQDISSRKAGPMIDFGSDANAAPVLSYNLPASTAYTVKLFVPVPVPDSYWNDYAKTLPKSIYVAPSKDPSVSLTKNPLFAPFQASLGVLQSSPHLTIPVASTPPKFGPTGGEAYVTEIYEKFTNLNPNYAVNAKAVESKVRELCSGYPELKILANLDLANDLLIEATSPQLKMGGGFKYGPTMLLCDLNEGKVPIWGRTFYGATVHSSSIPANSIDKAKPKLFVIEELEIASYLGKFGAGKTVKTFTLLPGEETTISVRTWRTKAEMQSKTDNILDSFSEDSADMFEKQSNDEFATSMQKQEDVANSFDTVSKKSSVSTKSKDDASGLLGLLVVDSDYSTNDTNQQEDDNSTFSSASVNRQDVANTFQSALDKHVGQSSAARKHDVNTESTQAATSTQGEEESITRHLKNINKGRVLNFVFRALNQEYVTLIYLKNVSFGFSQGIPGDGVASKLSNLDDFLRTYLDSEEHVIEIRNNIINNLRSVEDVKGKLQEFIVHKHVQKSDPNVDYWYWQKKPDLSTDENNQYSLTDSADVGLIKVDGIILSSASRVLPTDSIIVDALLGKGEALDDYNRRFQNLADTKAELKNSSIQAAIDILKESDPTKMKAKADAFSEMLNPPENREGEIPVVIRNTVQTKEQPD